MAYKDEYEVARLHLLADQRARLEAEFGTGVRTRVMLHPPLLRTLGLHHKIGLSRSARPVFRALRAARHLRGTVLDPFGHTAMRRSERDLIGEYLSTLDTAIAHLGPDNAGVVAQLAALPDVIRGYEDVKRRNVERFRVDTAAMLISLVGDDAARRPIDPWPPKLPLAG
jgi:indolepyruvate ferredoxin oxidoreductase